MPVSADAPRYDGSVPLTDGRRLGFAEFGDPAGRPVLWLHGTPGSSHQVPPAARRAAAALGLRLIGVERPGYGRSTPHHYDAVLDFAADLEQVVDVLGVERFALIGLSGGGPYVLACAHEMPSRVVAAGLLGGVAPGRGDDRIGGGLVSLAVIASSVLPLLREPLGWLLWGAVAALRPVAAQVTPYALHILPEADRAVLDDPAMRNVFVSDALRASRRWFGGPAYDATLFARHWGFALADVQVPVRIWQGDADQIVPLHHAVHQARLLPDVVLSVHPGGGHLAGLEIADTVLSTLADLWPAAVAGDSDVG